MELQLFTKGFTIGLAVAAPVGPVGILSLKRTFSEGHLCGLVSGLGISTADAIYGFVVVFGLTSISNFLLAQHLMLRVAGGLILCGLGLKTYFTVVAGIDTPSSTASTYWGAYFSALVLTLLNPLLILSFTAIFAGFGLVGPNTSHHSALTTVAGVFCGSAIWWVGLSGFISRLSINFNHALIQKINLYTGALIACLGIMVIGSAWFM